MKRFLFLFLAFATVRGLLGSGNADSIRDSRLFELQTEGETMKYETNDLILPILQNQGRIPDPCPVKIEVSEKYVTLCVGPRDWQWNKETGEMVGAGTSLCPPVPFEGESPVEERKMQ